MDKIVDHCSVSIFNNSRLRDLGIRPETQETYSDRQYPYVVFSVPLSGSSDYPASVEQAIQCWDHSGSCVFTSSTGVYPKSGHVTEDTPTIPLGTSERVDKLIKAEDIVLKAGGNVVRLGGLYHAMRGAHSAFIRRKSSSQPADRSMYLLHYQDAAELVLQVLLRGSDFKGEIFLGIESQPVTAKETVDAALASGLYEGEVAYAAAESENQPGRTMDCTKTRERLGSAWVPQYEYSSFMRSGGEDWYRT